MANNWIKLEVYNHGSFIGSFYADINHKSEIKHAIDNEYGTDNWTKYNIGN